jgi:hypothetical protein
VRQHPNRILSRFKPAEVWISGGDPNHPAREFLAYLQGERDYLQPRIAVTNENEHVEAMKKRMPIDVMHGTPFTADL